MFNDVTKWILDPNNRSLIAFIVGGITGTIGILYKLTSYLKKRKKHKSAELSFDIVKTPNIPHFDAQEYSTKPNHYIFKDKCLKYFVFGNGNPVFDITIVNHSEKSILLTGVGVEVASVAHRWYIGAIVEAFTVRIEAIAIIRMPNVWEILKNRRYGTSNASFSIGKKNIEDIMKQFEDIPPQKIGVDAICDLRDPVCLDVDTPFRYALILSDYMTNMPAHSIVRFVAKTNKGVCRSGPFYIYFPSDVLHAETMSEEEMKAKNYLDTATSYFRMRDYANAEMPLKQAINILSKTKGENNPEVIRYKHNLGVLYYQQGKYNDAKRIYDVTVPYFERQYGHDHPEFMNFLNDLKLLREAIKGQ